MARYSPTSLTECRSTTWALRRLADRGVRITIDDLGTGYCSFNSLRRMPVYALKIDRQFVAELSAPKTFQSGFAIVSAIVSPAIFVFDVIAEGVETQAQLDFSIGSAVLAQGDHIGRSGGIVAVRAVRGDGDPATRPTGREFATGAPGRIPIAGRHTQSGRHRLQPRVSRPPSGCRRAGCGRLGTNRRTHL
jgi:EAL domain-containing protein (putative c-di-GMP-specific phosphodiesterase class I)